jgi:PAS domain S-box-containing protein
MRSSYTDEQGNIFVGTLEGVFMIRPHLLLNKPTPPPPFVLTIQNKLGGQLLDIKDDNVFLDGENNVSIVFKSINTKNDFVKYSYRLIGWNEEWSEWSEEGVAMFSDLPSGNYRFEAKATMDGEKISNVRVYEFIVNMPFYKSKWFILLGITLIVVLNIVLLEKTKKFSRKNIILSKDTATDSRGIAAILLFGAFANTGAHLFASRIDPTIENHDLATYIAGFIVFALFILVTFVDSFKARSAALLTIGFTVIISQNFIGVYYSELHPFFLMAIILTCFVSPIVFTSFKSAIAFSFIMIAVAIGIVFNLKDTYYDQFLFMVGIFIAAFLTVFMTYLRNNSLEKLIFTSGVVNKGNVLVIAFDRNGKISYNSENITKLIDINGGDLKGVFVSDLNKYQPKFESENKFANVDLKNEFREGKIFVTPLFTKFGEVVYYQWSCKEFSEDVRVILGQDVTDKINLENYYELIVHNADDLIFQTDPYANLTFVNNKCIETFKYSEEEILGKSTTFIIHPDYKSTVKEFYNKQFLERKRTTYFEFPIIDGEGEERWLGQNVTTLFKPGADNIITGFLGLARDITEKRKANAIIKEQNMDITASINYARRIQFNMLPRSTDFERYFDEHFVLFKPKDIVSGDFYWVNEVDGKVIVICSDCTGHGVPGSFMTLLGINLLNQIILEAKVTDAAQILNELDHRLIEVLPRDGRNKVKDGMEAVVLVFHKDDTNVQYACAGGRFAITDDENDELLIYKGDHKHIGDVLDDAPEFKYSAHELSIESNQTVYLFTDGYPDQFGGDRNKKLTFKKYLGLLNTISNQSLTEQNYILKDHLKEWIGEYPQTDDITVIGIKDVKSYTEL